jgi:hypothetical protein
MEIDGRNLRGTQEQWTSSCHHHGRKDGSGISGGETLNKTHNNQSLNPNGAVTTDYKGSRDMGRLVQQV